jgi:hypothetical protein
VSREAVNATRKRRSRAEVSCLVEQYLSSGLSLEAFCQQHLDRSTPVRRLRQRQNLTSQPPQPAGWVGVELSSGPDPVSVGAPSGVTLVVAGGRRIERARHFDAVTLHQQLHLLESR